MKKARIWGMILVLALALSLGTSGIALADNDAAGAEPNYLIDGMYVTGDFVLISGTAADDWDTLFSIGAMTFSPDDESVSLPVDLAGDERFPTSPLGQMTAYKTEDGLYAVYDSTGAAIGSMTVADGQVTVVVTAGPLSEATYAAELETAEAEPNYLIDGKYVTGDFVLTDGTAADDWDTLFSIGAMTFSPDDESVSLPVDLAGDERFPTSPLGQMTACKTEDGLYEVYDSTGAAIGSMTVADGQVTVVVTAGPLDEATYVAELEVADEGDDYLIDGKYVTGDFALTAGTAADDWDTLFSIGAMTFSPDDESVSLPVDLAGDERFPTSPLGQMTAYKTEDGLYAVYDSTGSAIGSMTVADGLVTVVVSAGPLSEATYTAELQK